MYFTAVEVHVVLQMVQGLAMISNTVMLSLTIAKLCHYQKLGCGLPRSEATMA